MDKFGMYKRVVRSCGAERPEDKPQTPLEVGGMIQNGGKTGGNVHAAQNRNKAANGEKPVSHALRAFLESQARHERLSREIDVKNGIDKSE